MNATLSYQITVTNTSDQPLHNVAIFGDLASAHASVPVAEQLAQPLARAAEAIDSGTAAQVLDRWVAATQAARG